MREWGGKKRGGCEPQPQRENTTGMVSRQAEQEVQTEHKNEGVWSNNSSKKPGTQKNKKPPYPVTVLDLETISHSCLLINETPS